MKMKSKILGVLAGAVFLAVLVLNVNLMQSLILDKGSSFINLFEIE